MGGAMLRGWIAQGMDPADILVIDPAAPQVPAGVACVAELPQTGPSPALLVLAIKPQMIDEIAPSLAPLLAADTLLLSILAGVEIEGLRARFPAPRSVVRAMPNLPASIGKGATALYGEELNETQRADIRAFMSPLGLVEWIDDEALFDAVIAVSGSGPAFVFRYIDAVAATGAELGLPVALAMRLAIATVEGSAALVAASPDNPATLAERVRSPGGTTNAGLDTLDAGGVFTARVRDVMLATAARSAQMAREARTKKV